MVFSLAEDGTLLHKGRICVPKDEEMRKQILSEAHETPYSVHPGATKMYKDLKNELLVARNEEGRG